MLWLKRLRLYQNERTLIMVGLLFIVTLSIGFYMAATPTTYAVTETIEKNTYSTDYTHYSESSQDSELFDEGERSVTPSRYYIQNHKEVEMKFTVRLNEDKINESNYSVTYSVYVTAEMPTSDEIVYKKSIVGENTEIVSVSGDNVSIDMAAYQNYRESLLQELPQGSRIVLNVDRSTSVSGNDIESVNLTSTTDVYFSNVRTYIVDVQSEPVENREKQTVQRPQPAQTIEIGGGHLDTTGLFVVITSFGILLIFSYLVYVRLYIDKDQDQIRFEYEVNKYSSWITSGKPYQDPTFQDDSDIIQVESIKGLVDIAVDNTTRVVHTEQSGRFYVYDEDVIYTYTAPGRNMGLYVGPEDHIPDFNPDQVDSGDPFSPEDVPDPDEDVDEPIDRSPFQEDRKDPEGDENKTHENKEEDDFDDIDDDPFGKQQD